MRRNLLSRPFKLYYRPLAVASAIVVAGIGACSSVPDEANPVKWYEGVASLIEDDDETFGDGPVEPAPGGDDPFPNLASVPDAPRAASAPEDLARLAEGLVADRDNAQYTDEVLRSRYADDDTRLREDTLAAATPKPSTPEPASETVADTVRAVEAPIERVETLPAVVVAESEYTARDTDAIEAASTAVLRDRIEAEDAQRITTAPLAAQERQTETVAPRTVARAEERVERTERPVETAVRQPETPATPAQPRQRSARAEPPANAGRAPSPRYAGQPLTLAGFKSLFNERFEASGRPPEAIPVRYQSGETGTAASQDDGPLLGLADLTSPSSPISGNGITFQAANIQFGSGGASLSRDAQAKLREVAALHQQYGGFVKVVGHSSRRTGAMDHSRHQLINFKISVDRAQAVATALQRLGVPASALIVSAAGDNEPIAHEYMPEGEAANRRAEIFIQY